MMRKLSIGRAPECDITIKDASEKVSRRHAVLTFSPTGKMTLYDTSSNGTTVNGKRMKKGQGVEVKRGDKINFGNAVDLDWDTIKDPYAKTRVLWLILFIVLALGIAAFFIYSMWFAEKMVEKEQVETVTTEQTDSVPSESSAENAALPAKTPEKAKTRDKKVTKTESGTDSVAVRDDSNQKGKNKSNSQEANPTSPSQKPGEGPSSVPNKEEKSKLLEDMKNKK